MSFHLQGAELSVGAEHEGVGSSRWGLRVGGAGQGRTVSECDGELEAGVSSVPGHFLEIQSVWQMCWQGGLQEAVAMVRR